MSRRLHGARFTWVSRGATRSDSETACNPLLRRPPFDVAPGANPRARQVDDGRRALARVFALGQNLHTGARSEDPRWVLRPVRRATIDTGLLERSLCRQGVGEGAEHLAEGAVDVRL